MEFIYLFILGTKKKDTRYHLISSTRIAKSNKQALGAWLW